MEFSDTDMAGIMHFSNFFRFMETAEHGFYRSLGFSVIMPETDPRLGWPRVHAGCDYRKPLRFEDLVEIHLLVSEKKIEVAQLSLSLSQAERVGRARSGPRNTDHRLCRPSPGRHHEGGSHSGGNCGKNRSGPTRITALMA